jgi:hypothetical protein
LQWLKIRQKVRQEFHPKCWQKIRQKNCHTTIKLKKAPEKQFLSMTSIIWGKGRTGQKKTNLCS